MAYVQARSGLVRSNAFHCGWTPASWTVYIAGTDRNANVQNHDQWEWTLTLRADGSPATFTFQTYGITPAVGQDVKVVYATPNDYLFGGTLLQANAQPTSSYAAAVRWNCTAVGYHWLLDRYTPVLAQYRSVGVGTMVADLLYRFSNGSFKAGYIPSSLGNLSMDFTFESVWGALQRIAKAVGAVVRVTPERTIDLYTGSYPEAALATVTENTILAESLTYSKDLTQVRTRTLYEGQGTTASSAVAAGSATVPVNDVGPFATAGGSAISGRSLFTYTTRSTESGAGSLTGCSGILYDIAAEDAVAIMVDATDSSAVTALATLLGGGLSGQATDYLQDGRLSLSELTARGVANRGTFGGALEDVSFTYQTPSRYVRPGRDVTLAVTVPIAISGLFTIQGVTLSRRGALTAGNFEVYQSVDLGDFTRTLTDVLKQAQGVRV